VAVCIAVRRLGIALCLLLWGGCSVHDPARLEPLPVQSSNDSGSGGLGGTMAGRGGQNAGGLGGLDGAGSGGTGGGGTGGTGGAGGLDDDDASVPEADGGDETRCGDGLVSGTELCDTALEPGEAGACPTVCPPLSACVMRALNGTGCRAECVVLQAQCEDGDGCCPGNCTPSNDDDCSSMCGDGIVQENEGETCEPEPIGDAGDAETCPEDCDDDDACTTDVLSGSVTNCSIECAHAEITALVDGDGCCPDGANMLTDSDCAADCGNNVRERGEDCDSATGCNESCDLGYSDEQRTCLDTHAITNQECALCMCTRCAGEKLACNDDSDEERGELCADLQVCVRASRCFDTSCYCQNVLACIPPDGPCVAEVEAAAETTNVFDIDGRKMNTNYAIGRSYALDSCIAANCASACD
jgi:hypothetical protein